MDQRFESSQYQYQEQEQPQTVMIKHLGSPFENFWNDFMGYLATNLSKKKKLAVGGLTGTRKTLLLMEILALVGADKRILQCQRENRFRYEPSYLNTGMELVAGRNIGVVTSPQGDIWPGEYRGSSLNSARIRRLAEDPELRISRGLTKDLETDELVLLSGIVAENKNDVQQEIEDTNRGISLAVQVYRGGGFVVLADAPLEVVEKKLKVVERIRQAKLEEVIGILEEEGIDDDRDPKEIKEAHQKTGDRKTREQQDRDVNWIISKLVLQKKLPWPRGFKEATPLAFKNHPEKRVEYIKNFYIPFWAGRLAGIKDKDIRFDELPPRIYYLNSEDLSPTTKIRAYGQKLREANLFYKIDQATSKPELEHLRRLFMDLGVLGPITPLSYNQNPGLNEEAFCQSYYQSSSEGNPYTHQQL